MLRTVKTFAVAAAAALALGLASAPSATAAPSEGFYDPPADLPAGNGTLVRSEPMKLALTLKGLYMPGTATRLLYTSTDEAGAPAAVTGAYIEPTKKWTGKGPRPLVAVAAGTQGQGDACAPSKSLETFLNVQGNELGIGYEIPSIHDFLNRGMAVVLTDYIGLGTTDRVHTYTNRLDMGHALLDAARAALKLPNTSVTAASPVGLYGYSQGGGAAGSAAELAPTYAPELNLKGAFAGAPPANLVEVLKSADGTDLTGVIAYAINGITPYHPELQGALDELATPAGKEALEKVKTQCIGSTLLSYGFQKTSKWTTNGKSLYDTVKNDPALRAPVDAQRIGTLKPSIPVQVLTGTKDDIVDHAQAKQLAKDWCAQGVNVTYVPVIQPIGTGGTALNHLTPMITRLVPSHDWLADRLAGKSVRSNCSSLWLLP
ncbi:triacylglycerol lipase [Aeromicrobium sp. 636]|uniref:Alpha/beta fold hydrolase n=1 Tax=Aeromicrobium senzhongii TaxID=2663859 RepID=A0A8I0K013_9ACTN|nr:MULTISPECIES: lipase family protein [Aeromicrobium]MBC9225876.1 alpha/beta fold hydrolase [Aeromicrobium senzhongii]MCQ3997983.1 triacylglycerol lipase [Aeromicrobium sp. 636]